MKWIKNARNFVLLFLTAVLAVLPACGSSTKETSTQATTQESAKSTAYQPVTIENYNRTLTFKEVPKRAVTLNQHVTEIMLALGLEDRMVGTAYLDDKILPEFQEAYSKIPVLSNKYPSKEVFMAAQPDFVYAGWKSAFTEKAVGTVEELEKAGIRAYLQESSDMTAPTLEDVYKDIQNIGRIFNVEAKANETINKMKKDMEQITKQIGPVDKPLKVFVYDSGEDQAFTAANNYMTRLISLAGGKNVFDDIQKGWAKVNWEEVVNRNPEVIIIVDYGEKTVAQKQDLLLAKKELADVPAIKNKRFIVLPLSAAAEGIRAPLALKILSKGFYPDKFKE
ncbi:ABC transporter substrate-binding protein [Effusibacillus consociatus]|uniref:ABC transporter substrate-binding protein n=1 Tax=Effusibacillus consociatus TaxID=1117041 RepID=A0ABV9QAG4_9BACL